MSMLFQGDCCSSWSRVVQAGLKLTEILLPQHLDTNFHFFFGQMVSRLLKSSFDCWHVLPSLIGFAFSCGYLFYLAI